MPLGVWRDIIGNSDVVRALWLQIVQWVEISSDSEVCLFVCFKGRIEPMSDESNAYLQSWPAAPCSGQ